MKSIKFDEGCKEYMINDDPSRVIRLRLDPNMIERYKKAVTKIEEYEKKYGDLSIDNMTQFDSELREILNGVFGTDICTPAFGEASLFTPTSEGEPLFVAFFEAFLPEIEKDIRAATTELKPNKKEVRPQVQKYLDAPSVKPVAGLAKPYGEALPDISGLTPEQKKMLAMQLLA